MFRLAALAYQFAPVNFEGDELCLLQTEIYGSKSYFGSHLGFYFDLSLLELISVIISAFTQSRGIKALQLPLSDQTLAILAKD